MNNLALLLRAYCWEHRISMRKLGRSMGISSATICRITQGRAVSLRVWMQVQQWLLATATGEKPKRNRG